MISFVGAGPGAEDLITLRGLERLKAADVVIWASSLVPISMLSHCAKDPQLYDSSGMTLEDVLKIYDDKQASSNIVRLHSGDPTIYGAIQEQIQYCKESQYDFEVVPGVSSLAATAAAVATELTVPKISQTIIQTRLANRTQNSMPQSEQLSNLAASGSTCAIYLSAANPIKLQKELLAPPSLYTKYTPAVVASKVSWPDENILLTTVGELAKTIKSTGQNTTVLVIVGDVLKGEEIARSHLYSPDFAHKFRKRSNKNSTVGRPTGITPGKLV